MRAELARQASASDRPSQLTVLDVADRVAGKGSLGVDRYVILTEGNGSPDDNFLIDVKAVGPSTPAALTSIAQPARSNEAERVVASQRLLQATSPKFLTAMPFGTTDYVLRELMPSEDRVKLDKADGPDLEEAVLDMARLTAWAHLRASGMRAAASASELQAFGRSVAWREPLARLATAAAHAAQADHAAFRTAWARGEVALPPAWE